MTFRVVHVGTGTAANRWLQNALDHDDVEIVGLVDVDAGRATGMAARYGLGWPTFPTLEAAVDATGANLVFVTTPGEAHASVAVAAMGLGCDVFTEKPLTTCTADALAVLAAAEETGRVCSVMQNRRYHPGVAAISAAIGGGVLGGVGLVGADFFHPGPEQGFRVELPHQLLLDMGVHAFDTARAVLGADPVRVDAVELNPAGSWTAGNAAVACLVEFDSGAVLSYRASWCAAGFATSFESAWRIAGTEASILWDGVGPPELERRVGARVALAVAPSPAGEPGPPRFDAAVPDLRTGTFHRECLAEMLGARRAGRPSATDCRANFASAAAVFAAVESARSRQPVEVPKPLDHVAAGRST